jgi:hypothetical protein
VINRPKTKTDRIAFCSSQPTNQARHEIAISEAWKHWKTGGSGRIFREWRQLSDAIAAPSTNALKQSS